MAVEPGTTASTRRETLRGPWLLTGLRPAKVLTARSDCTSSATDLAALLLLLLQLFLLAL